ncbi:MAG: hypothetical protein PHR65_05170 [Syntrophomonadaceae bacterium]|nr:hypothetical protein [Syntrophomonadaceae bacterium]
MWRATLTEHGRNTLRRRSGGRGERHGRRERVVNMDVNLPGTLEPQDKQMVFPMRRVVAGIFMNSN